VLKFSHDSGVLVIIVHCCCDRLRRNYTPVIRKTLIPQRHERLLLRHQRLQCGRYGLRLRRYYCRLRYKKRIKIARQDRRAKIAAA
jgi:hypothetical protein